MISRTTCLFSLNAEPPLSRSDSDLCAEEAGVPIDIIEPPLSRSYSDLCAEEAGVPIDIMQEVLYTEGREKSRRHSEKVQSIAQHLWRKVDKHSFTLH